MDTFDTAMASHEQAAAPAPVSSPETNTQTDLSSSTSQTPAQVSSTPAQSAAVAQVVAELEKMEKFKFQGQEWTPKDLEKAILRQKDYTTKTSTLSEERKAFDGDRKYYENLAWDLQKLRENPSLADMFIKTYPAKFHAIAAEYLKNNQPQTNDQQSQSVQVQPQVDVATLSRLDRLEKEQQQREIKVNEQEIENIRTSLNEKYPSVAKSKFAQKAVLAEAFETFEANRAENPDFKLTRDDWENIYRSAAEDLSHLTKAEYGELVKKQTEANQKAKDVGAGGGTVGSAPVKFKRFDDLAKHAESLAKGG